MYFSPFVTCCGLAHDWHSRQGTGPGDRIGGHQELNYQNKYSL